MLEFIENGDLSSLLTFVYIRVAIILMCWFFIIMSTVIDFWSGTSTAKCLGEKLESKGFRRTFTKAGDYIKVVIFALMFDILGAFVPAYYLPFASMLCTIAVIWIEAKSVIENGARKKANAAGIPQAVKEIVEAATAEQGQKILTKLTEQLKAK